MHAQDDRNQFNPPKPPGRTRAVVLAVLAHIGLLIALTWGVAWKSGDDQPAVVAELWSAVPQQAAPRGAEPPTPVRTPTPPAPQPPPVPEPPAPAPAPAPSPAPKPAPPKAQPDTREADIAIEQEKQRKLKEQREEKEKAERDKQRKDQQRADQDKKDKLQKEKEKEKEKAEREKAERAKAEQAAQQKAEREKEQKKLAEDKRKKDEAIATADAKAADERRKKELERLRGMAGATGAANSTGTAQRDSGPSGSYGGKVAAKVKPNIVYPDAVSGNPRAEVEVRTSPDGTIVGTRLTKSSGNPAWDDAVMRALEKTATLPRDIDGRVPSSLVIGFKPQD